MADNPPEPNQQSNETSPSGAISAAAGTLGAGKDISGGKTKPQEAVPAPARNQPSDEDSDEGPLLRYAEELTFGVFGVLFVLWLCFMPWRSRSKYDLPPETDLCMRIYRTQIAANPSSSDQQVSLPPGCPNIANGKVIKKADLSPIRWLRPPSTAFDIQSGAPANSVTELLTDFNVWTRYEYELKTFEWGRDINWYIYSSLRILVLILSAITPALIVAPIFQKKKTLAALPAAIVAIGTGCITEFDFKNEAAAYTAATVQIQGEKIAFITRSSPTYYYHGAFPIGVAAAGGQKNSNYEPAALGEARSANQTQSKPPASESKQPNGFCGDNNVPFLPPGDYPQIRANFACQIQLVWHTQMGERILFLRGQQPQPLPSNQTNKPPSP